VYCNSAVFGHFTHLLFQLQFIAHVYSVRRQRSSCTVEQVAVTFHVRVIIVIVVIVIDISVVGVCVNDVK